MSENKNPDQGQLPMDPSAAATSPDSGTREYSIAAEVKVSNRLAVNYGVQPRELVDFIGKNIINTGNGPAATPAEVFAVMSIMDRYGLDPWMKQVHAFRHQGRFMLMIGYDGWVWLANQKKDYMGVTYEFSKEMVKSSDGKARSWECIVATLHRAGRHPVSIPCFFSEWYVPCGSRGEGSWQKQPTHRHRQKAFTMVIREGYGISALDEADRDQLTYRDIQATTATAETADTMVDRLKRAAAGRETADEKPESENYSDPGGYQGDSVDALFDDLPEG